MTTPATRLSDGDQGAFDFGSAAVPGRPGKVIRLHPTTRERHLDLLQWGLLSHATENPDSALCPLHVTKCSDDCGNSIKDLVTSITTSSRIQ
jgi:hypothetical protein